MQVNDHLQSVKPSPADRFREVGELARNIRFAGSNLKGPVAYGNSNMVQAEVWAYALDGNQNNRSEDPHPAAAMSARSCSVIQVSQCCFRVAAAVALS